MSLKIFNSGQFLYICINFFIYEKSGMSENMFLAHRPRTDSW